MCKLMGFPFGKRPSAALKRKELGNEPARSCGKFLEAWQKKKLATGKDGNTRDEGLRVFSSWSDCCGTSNRFWICRGLKNWWRPARIAVPNGQILSGATIRIVNDCVMGK